MSLAPFGIATTTVPALKNADDYRPPPLPSGVSAATSSSGSEPPETCAGCRQPLVRRGRKSECLRCLANFVFEPAGETLPPSAAPARPVPGSGARRYGHFEIELDTDSLPWELGAGAMATTYRAYDTVLHTAVALKVINQSLAAHPAARARFLREARAAARIHHLNVAGVTHYGEQDGECYYVMELVEGETLEARLQREGPLPPALVLEIGVQTARALAAAEACGVLHRDLKPANIMLTVAQGETAGSASTVVKVIDWGLAKALSADSMLGTDLTHGGFVGTPAFASPEQLSGSASQPIDARADIYSLGVTLWYLLCGRRPFAGTTIGEIHSRQTQQALPLEQLSAARVPGRLVTLLKSMLAVEPAARPQSARELLEALRGCQERSLVGAGPRQVRRRRARRAGVASGLLAVAAGAVMAGWGHSYRLASAPADRSIAVLPFENLSPDQENAFFADGVQEEILTDLAKVADLKVIARSSVVQYRADAPRDLRAIAAELGVTHLLEGSVQRAGNQVRVSAQLIDARTNAPQWAERYDRNLSDVFAIQSEIARTIAGQLQARLSPREKSAIDGPSTTDLQAYDLYLRAQALYELNVSTVPNDKMVEAVGLLEQALARDPRFLAAQCLLARTQYELYRKGDHTPERLEKFGAAVRAAVRLAPDAGETHLELANYHYQRRDYARATAELALAKRSLPNEAQIPELTGYLLRRQGQGKEAFRNLEQALNLEPRDFHLLQQLGRTYRDTHRYADAEHMLQRALVIQPGDPYTRLLLASVPLFARADLRPWQSTLAALLEENPVLAAELDEPETALLERNPTAFARALAHLSPAGSVVQGGVRLPRAYWEGVFARCQGDTGHARDAFTAARAEVAETVAARPDPAVAVSYLGVTDAGLGRKEDAIAEGRRACGLIPVSKDALIGWNMTGNLALIYAWTGEKAAAVEALSEVERVPNEIPYAQLKLGPQWDDLRGDPGFEALVASLAPKP